MWHCRGQNHDDVASSWFGLRWGESAGGRVAARAVTEDDPVETHEHRGTCSAGAATRVSPERDMSGPGAQPAWGRSAAFPQLAFRRRRHREGTVSPARNRWRRILVAATAGAIGGAGVRVLVIEDDDELAEAIGAGLRQERMAVDVAFDGASGLERALVTDYDVIVLDRDLPGRHGDEVCAELVRAGARSRVLMLTAAATIEDRVDGLGLGADDYLPKPFAFAELVARLRALLRRAQPPLAPVLERGDLRLDPARRSASRAGQALELGPKEFGVLELLLAAQGRVVSAEELLERVWDEMADPFTTAVKVTMSRLRRKLGDPPVIETLAQAGYRIPT
jgi:DNA-binding response OmpR family regulator